MRVAITGAGGQLATELLYTVSGNIDAVGLSIEQCDITSIEGVQRSFDSIQPEIVINAAAWTDVDGAEQNEEAAYLVNESGAKNLALWAADNNAHMIHISTDCVFDGKSTEPYKPTDVPFPISIYGQSKLAGEVVVQKILKENSLIVRTAWLYSHHGHNFVNTMLKLFNEREEVRVVNDQTGSPTWARDLAHAIWSVIDIKPSGITHWVNSGEATWFDFASEIYDNAIKLGIINQPIKLCPIPSSEWLTPTDRPKQSVLSTIDSHILYPAREWKIALGAMIETTNTLHP